MIHYLTLDDYRVFAAAVLACDENHVPFRDIGAADSALHSIQPIFGHDPHPDPRSKAAVLLYRLARAHPLADGNKRTATLVALAFAGLNGLRCTATVADLEDLIVDGAAGELSQEEFVQRFSAVLEAR